MVFTEYAATLDWIAGILAQRGYRNGIELATIQGSTDPEDRADIRARFTAPPDKHPVRVLVATDSAGEGIDLQDYCHRLVNFDIPFNPSRLEQRIGRIDRYGQQNAPEIYQLRLPPRRPRSTPRDLQVPRRHRHRQDRQVAADLGSVNQVIDVDAEIQEHLTGTRGAGASRGAATAARSSAGPRRRPGRAGPHPHRSVPHLRRAEDEDAPHARRTPGGWSTPR